GPSLSARPEPLERRPLVDVCRGDHERARVQTHVVLGVGCGRGDDLGDLLGRRLRREPQHRQCLLDALAADQIHDATRLHRRDPDEPGGRLGALRRRLDIGFSTHRRLLFRSSLMWPLNVLVGANSPSLWPTMFSEMNTGTCLRPSWTANVWPMKSGMTVDRRDQVLMTCLVPFSFCESTFARRWSSTNGPFLRLRGILHSLLALVLAGTATADDHRVAGLVGTAGAAFELAPRAHRVPAAGGLALTAAVRVVHGVHHDAA